jgi:hypothetical protein
MTFYLKVVVTLPDPKFVKDGNWIAWDTSKIMPGETGNIDAGKTVYGRTAVTVTGGPGKIKTEIYNDTDKSVLDSDEYTVTPPHTRYWTGSFRMPSKNINVKFNTYYWDGAKYVLNDWVGCRPRLIFRLRRFVRHLRSYRIQVVRRA